MSWTKWLQETRQMRFKEIYEKWTIKRLSQEEAAQLLGAWHIIFALRFTL